jgi:hypothetical protein
MVGEPSTRVSADLGPNSWRLIFRVKSRAANCKRENPRYVYEREPAGGRPRALLLDQGYISPSVMVTDHSPLGFFVIVIRKSGIISTSLTPFPSAYSHDGGRLSVSHKTPAAPSSPERERPVTGSFVRHSKPP